MFEEPELKPETARKLKLWRLKNGKKRHEPFGKLPKRKELLPKQVEDRQEHEAAVARLADAEG